MRCVSRPTIAGLLLLGGAVSAFAQDADPMPGLDWSVALRGSYAISTVTGVQTGLDLAPDVSLTLGGERTTSRLSAGSVLSVDGAGQARVSDLHGGAEGVYRLDALTRLDGSVTGAWTQGQPNASGLPANTLHAPQVLDGIARGAITRDLDRIDLRASVEGRRYMRGPTTLDDLTTIDNTERSYWSAGAALRAGYEITPLIAAFVEGRVGETAYDAPSSALATYMNGRTYELRGGMSYVQGSIIAAEASFGRAWLDYLDPALSDAPGWTYNASVTFNPDETLSLTGALGTTLQPSETVAGDTDIEYVASARATYRVNPWVTLRTSAGWDQTVTLGTSDTTWGYEAGAGVDYRSSRYIVWSADYLFSRDYAPPTPLNDTHKVTVGVKVQR